MAEKNKDRTVKISKAIVKATTAVITPNDLRLHLMDYVDMNIPLYKEHLTDEKLWKCIEWGIQHFNDMPPKLSKTYTGSNFPYKKLLLDLATAEALWLTSLVELRGEMQYSDGGIQSTIYYKSPQFSQLRQEMLQRAEQEAATIKRAENTNSCYGELC